MTTPLPPLPPTTVPTGWDWPVHVPAADLQRIIDQQMIVFFESAPRATWEARQDALLAQLFAFARTASPAWRERLGDGDRPEARARLAVLPVLDRDTFRAFSATPLPLPESHGTPVAHATSGTTGPPVGFFVSDHALRIVRNHYAADHLRHARNLLERRATIGPHVPAHPAAEHVFSAGNPWLGESPGFARQSRGYSAQAHAHWLASVAPSWLSVPPALLAEMLEAFGQGAPAPRGLKQVMTSGQRIAPELRRRTRDLLGASIRDRYACEETGPLALQCPADGTDEPAMHVCVANAVVEVLDDAGMPRAPGEPGRVVATALHHWASPAIRYDTGDVARLLPRCRCGADVPALLGVMRAAN